MLRAGALVVLLLGGCEPERAPAPGDTSDGGVPSLSLPKRRGDIAIDGRLDDAGWRDAADSGPFVNVGTGKPLTADAPLGGRVKLCWDETFLYLGLSVRDTDVRGGFPAGAVDPPLWTRDTVEIMIDPDGDGDNRDYYEIQINPQNLVFDSHFDDYNQPRGGPEGPFGHQAWRAELDSAVVVDGTLDQPGDRDAGYVVEARIRWRSFARAKRTPPAAGDRWRMNFYAIQNNGGVAWSPILGRGNFHRASRFGRVTFDP